MRKSKKFKQAFREGSDPTGSRRTRSNGFGGNTFRGTASYPDKTEFLDAPESSSVTGKVPFPMLAVIAEAQMQGHSEHAVTRSGVEPIAASAAGLTDKADDQTRVRDRYDAVHAAAVKKSEFASEVLTNYVLHYGRGWVWLYAFVWVALILGDLAAGSLVLIKGGEEPIFAAVFTFSIGVAMVTSGKAAEEIRRRFLWLRWEDDLPDDAEERRLIVEVFTYGDKVFGFLSKMITWALISVGCLVVGTWAVRAAADSITVATGFALWAVGICGGSFINAFYHCDPGHVTMKVRKDAVRSSKKDRDKAPTDAIEQRALNLAAVVERLLAGHARAWALWYTKLAEGFDNMAANPQRDGHGTDGLSELLSIRPNWADDFEALFDQHQVPRYYLDRSIRTPTADPGTPADIDDDSGAASDDVTDVGVSLEDEIVPQATTLVATVFGIDDNSHDGDGAIEPDVSPGSDDAAIVDLPLPTIDPGSDADDLDETGS